MASHSAPRDPAGADTNSPDEHRALAVHHYSRAAENASLAVKYDMHAKLHEDVSAAHAGLAAQHAQNAGFHIVLADQLLLAVGQPPHREEQVQRALEHRVRAAGHHASAVHHSALADGHADLAAHQRVAGNHNANLAVQRGDAARTHLAIAARPMRHAAVACLVFPADGPEV